ncbi:LytTR family transcriptional regulator DNA-binding domain-containing protein [Thiohalorhabdus sp. Cl-TMA]|uniref:LytTR family transcriptional regulator DNA-binding domain-containing protein n=1 Tax=Thiohalorhabdus methylotrophus TaxID=3242694 RepID=A0ABV4TS41_9GAMM
MGDRPTRSLAGETPGSHPESCHRALERIPVGILLLAPPDRIQSVNPALSTFVPEALEAHTLRELLTPWARQRFEEEALPAAYGEGHWHGELGLQGPEGARPVQLDLIAACNPSGAEGTSWIGLVHAGGMSPSRTDHPPRRIPVPLQGETRLLHPDEILMLAADRHYTHIHSATEHLLASRPLASLQADLSSRSFLRVHRSFLVNISKIRSLWRDKGLCYLRLNDLPDFNIPVSRRRLPQVEELLGLRSAFTPA